MAKSKTKKTNKARAVEVPAPEPETAPEADVQPAEAEDAPTPRNPDLPGIEGPGVAQPRIKALDKATTAYVEARNARMALTEEEVATKQALVALMHQNNLTTYRFDDYVVKVLPGKETLKVKNAADETETLGVGGDEGGDGE